MKRALTFLLIPFLCLACAGASGVLGDWIELATEELEALLAELTAACDEGGSELEILLSGDGDAIRELAVCTAVELLENELARRRGDKDLPTDDVYEVFRDGNKIKFEKTG